MNPHITSELAELGFDEGLESLRGLDRGEAREYIHRECSERVVHELEKASKSPANNVDRHTQLEIQLLGVSLDMVMSHDVTFTPCIVMPDFSQALPREELFQYQWTESLRFVMDELSIPEARGKPRQLPDIVAMINAHSLGTYAIFDWVVELAMDAASRNRELRELLLDLYICTVALSGKRPE